MEILESKVQNIKSDSNKIKKRKYRIATGVFHFGGELILVGSVAYTCIRDLIYNSEKGGFLKWDDCKYIVLGFATYALLQIPAFYFAKKIEKIKEN